MEGPEEEWKEKEGEKWGKCDIHFCIEESLDINVNKYKYSVYPLQYNRYMHTQVLNSHSSYSKTNAVIKL